MQVSCGWYHNVARGVRPDGSLAFYGWGKNDLKQLPVRSVDENVSYVVDPVPLSPLPEDRTMVEVWCGSEFTIALDDAGCLWSHGWNEHGNLGIGHQNALGEDRVWRPIQSLRLLYPWEGFLACGGAHVICIGSTDPA